MTQDDILWLAAKACYSYFDIYRRFPLRVGVHPYWRDLRFMDIRFPAPSNGDTWTDVIQGKGDPDAKIGVHIVPFMVYLHPDVQPEQVWLYHPDATDWVPSDLIFTLAGVPMNERQRCQTQGAD